MKCWPMVVKQPLCRLFGLHLARKTGHRHVRAFGISTCHLKVRCSIWMAINHRSSSSVLSSADIRCARAGPIVFADRSIFRPAHFLSIAHPRFAAALGLFGCRLISNELGHAFNIRAHNNKRTRILRIAPRGTREQKNSFEFNSINEICIVSFSGRASWCRRRCMCRAQYGWKMFRICVRVLVDCTLFVILLSEVCRTMGDGATPFIVRYTSPECNLLTIVARKYEVRGDKKCGFLSLLLRLARVDASHLEWRPKCVRSSRVYIEQANNPIRIGHNRQSEETVETRRFSHYTFARTFLPLENYKLFMHALSCSDPLHCSHLSLRRRRIWAEKCAESNQTRDGQILCLVGQYLFYNSI